MTTPLLLTAIALPVVLYWLLSSRSRMHGMAAGAIAVATGWALNVAWAFASRASMTIDPAHAGEDNVTIAMLFGWACPTVLVFVTWLVRRFLRRRAG